MLSTLRLVALSASLVALLSNASPTLGGLLASTQLSSPLLDRRSSQTPGTSNTDSGRNNKALSMISAAADQAKRYYSGNPPTMNVWLIASENGDLEDSPPIRFVLVRARVSAQLLDSNAHWDGPSILTYRLSDPSTGQEFVELEDSFSLAELVRRDIKLSKVEGWVPNLEDFKDAVDVMNSPSASKARGTSASSTAYSIVMEQLKLNGAFVKVPLTS
ncbi:MAG: hypothetical protein M1829_002214 [Trizodia sp. TS-e1964]|nr:MAG: hypothetical protein M1829_002214 [Trizodia sp. TS-e1964]